MSFVRVQHTASLYYLYSMFYCIKGLSCSDIAWPLPLSLGRGGGFAVWLCWFGFFWMLNFPFFLSVCLCAVFGSLFAVNYYLPSIAPWAPLLWRKLSVCRSLPQELNCFSWSLLTCAFYALVLRIARHRTHADLKPRSTALAMISPATPITHWHSTH